MLNESRFSLSFSWFIDFVSHWILHTTYYNVIHAHWKWHINASINFILPGLHIFRNKWRRFQKHKKLYHQLCPKSFFVVTTTGGRCRFLCVRKIYLLSYSYYVNLHFRIFSSLEKYQKQGNNLFRVWIKTNNYVRNFLELVLIRIRLLSSFRVFSFNMLWNVQMKKFDCHQVNVNKRWKYNWYQNYRNLNTKWNMLYIFRNTYIFKV